MGYIQSSQKRAELETWAWSHPADLHLRALSCKAGCNNFYSLLTALFPSTGSFALLISSPSSHPLVKACLVPPITFTGTADPISMGAPLAPSFFSQMLSLLLTVNLLLVSNGNATTFRITPCLSSPIWAREAHTPQALSTPGLLLNPKDDEQVIRKKLAPPPPPPIKHSVGKNNHSCIQMNTFWFTPLGLH